MDSIALHVRRTLGAVMPVSALLLALPLHAQQAVDSKDKVDDTGALQEVIVTAQYRSENLQSTPIAITAVSGEQLEKQGLTNVSDLGNIVPNANIRPNPANGPTPNIGMRGVNTSEFIYTTEPGVAVYVDDVYHGTLTGSAMDLLDLERVEVLRGPQGTLFGKNALGGAIRLISKDPKGDNTGYVEATYGSSRRMDLKAGFDFAVRENLFMRVTGVAKHIEGYQERLDFACQMIADGTPQLAGTLPLQAPSNETKAGNCKTGENGGSENQAVRAMLRYLATDNLEVNLTGDYSHTDAEPGAQALLTGTQSTGLDQLYNNLVIQPRFGLRYDDNRFVTASNPFVTYMSFSDPVLGRSWPTDWITNTWSETGKVDYKITNDISLKAIVGHRAYESNWDSGDLIPLGSGTYNLQKHAQNSYELRLSGSLFDHHVEWTTGGFYFDSQSALGGSVTFGALSYFHVIPDFNQNDHFTTKSKSGFAHAVWRITDKLSLTGGVRQTQEDKTFAFDHTGYLTVPVPLQYGNSHFDYKVDADYALTDGMMVYATVSTGFRSDGANPRPWAANQLLPVPMETIRAFEVGSKSDFLDHRLRVNTSFFLNDYSPRVFDEFGYSCNPTAATPGPFVPFGTPACPAGTQLAGQSPSNGVFWFNYISAPGKARGAELEITAEPIRNLTLNASAGLYTFTSSVGPTQPGYIDPSVREQPKFSGSVGAQYSVALGGYGAVIPRIDLFYQGARTNGTENLPQLAQGNYIPAYSLVNARLTYASGDGKWTAAISAENLLNKFYWYQLGATESNLGNGTSAPVYGATGAPGRPREVAFTIERKL